MIVNEEVYHSHKSLPAPYLRRSLPLLAGHSSPYWCPGQGQTHDCTTHVDGQGDIGHLHSLARLWPPGRGSTTRMGNPTRIGSSVWPFLLLKHGQKLCSLVIIRTRDRQLIQSFVWQWWKYDVDKLLVTISTIKMASLLLFLPL